MSRDIKKRWLRMLAFATLVTASVILRPAHSKGSDLGVHGGDFSDPQALSIESGNLDAALEVGLRF